MKKVIIVGGGLAGSEAAWQLAKRDIKVELLEMRTPQVTTFAHKSDKLCELVCSNSFRSDDSETAIGILHSEMRALDSLILKAADLFKIPAGSALAVDREGFSDFVEQTLLSHPNITIKREKICHLPINNKDNIYIFATGPLTAEELTSDIIRVTGEENLAFFDAIAPTIFADSIDYSKAWFQSRYDKGSGKDYLNCPLNKEEYLNFIDAILTAEKVDFKDWEKDTPYFEGCLPIEVMASRGVETLRYGPMKPVGLTNPHNTEKPYAVVQLRADNKLATIYNIVGFQTKLKYQAQKDIFRTIPGLEKAEFARLGGIHRNTFINSPRILDQNLGLKSYPNIKFAGQITGVEGYVESAACGLLAGLFTFRELLNKDIILPPAETAIGSLYYHITVNSNSDNFQPMNVNFGLFPPLKVKVHKNERKAEYARQARLALKEWLGVMAS